MAAIGRLLRSGIGARAILAAIGGIVVIGLLAPPALAQFGYPNQNNRRGGSFDSFWGGFGAPRTAPTEPRADYSRAPVPRKSETTPTSVVLVLGDSMADWLAYGLEDALADTPEIGVVRKHRTSSGLIRYDNRNDNADWAQAAREAIAATKPKYIVMMVGLNDRQAVRVRQAATPPAGATTPAAAPSSAATASPGAAPSTDPAETPAPETPAIVAPEPHTTRVAYHVYDFRTDPWVEQYTKRIDATIAALKSANVPVFWVGLPSIRGPKSTADMQFLDDLYRERAEKSGITFIDVWDGFVDDAGRFTPQGPDFEGQIRRLRVGDGVHFTKAGARKLAHYVDRELRRLMAPGVTAVALPSSDVPAQTPAARPGQPAQRPLAGPVLPLTVSTTGQQDLAGGGPLTAPAGQPIVTRTLQKGEALSAPAGRSDDFAWPRREIAPFGADPVVATTTDPIPVMHAAPASTTVPVPNEETRPVAATVPRRAVARAPQQQQPHWWQQWQGQQPQQQQQRRQNSYFGGMFR